MSQSDHSFETSERIKLTLKRENGDEAELPLRMLVMGNYQGISDNTPLRDRTSVNIDKRNFNRVMHEMAPHLKTTVPNHLPSASSSDESRELALDIRFRSMDDFHPDNLARQVPSLDHLLRLRALLTDLKRHPDQYQQIMDLFVHLIMDECECQAGKNRHVR